MSVNTIPDGHHTINSYSIVANPEELIDFVVTVFGGKEVHRSMRADGSIMHSSILVGDSTLMLGGATSEWPPQPVGMYVYIPDVDDAYRRALACGATSLMEPSDQFYGDRMGGVVDPTGNVWWIATHLEDVSPEEMTRREVEMQEGAGVGDE